jgi:hypothetical protein
MDSQRWSEHQVSARDRRLNPTCLSDRLPDSAAMRPVCWRASGNLVMHRRDTSQQLLVVKAPARRTKRRWMLPEACQAMF